MVINVIRLFLECTKLVLVLCGILNLKRKRKPICALLLEDKRRVLYAVLAMLGVCFIDDTIYFLVKWIFVIPEEILNRNSFVFFAVSTGSVILFAIIAWVLQCVYKKRESVGKAVRDMATPYLIIFLIGLFAVSFMTQPFNISNFQWNIPMLALIGSWVFIFCGAFFIVVFLLINSNHAKKNYMRMVKLNEKYLQMVEDYYETLSEKDEEVRRFRHDIKNHMLCMEALLKEGEYKEAEEYLEGLKGALHEMSGKFQTGNMLVNAIVNDVAGKYTGVMLYWNGILPQKTQLPNPDVCVIFSNILDNAFSAAADCTEGGRVDFSYTDTQFTTKILFPNVL